MEPKDDPSLGPDYPELRGKYKVLEKIGEGAFSEVFKAVTLQHVRTFGTEAVNDRTTYTIPAGTTVALKRITQTSSFDRVIHEAELLRSLGGTCPYVHGILHLEADKASGQATLVLPYISHAHFKNYYYRMCVADIQRYMYALFSALTHVHALGVIHRDLKPANFLHQPGTDAYSLVDFGLAEPAYGFDEATGVMPTPARVLADYCAAHSDVPVLLPPPATTVLRGLELVPREPVTFVAGPPVPAFPVCSPLPQPLPPPRASRRPTTSLSLRDTLLHAHTHDSPPLVTTHTLSLARGTSHTAASAAAVNPVAPPQRDAPIQTLAHTPAHTATPTPTPIRSHTRSTRARRTDDSAAAAAAAATLTSTHTPAASTTTHLVAAPRTPPASAAPAPSRSRNRHAAALPAPLTASLAPLALARAGGAAAPSPHPLFQPRATVRRSTLLDAPAHAATPASTPTPAPHDAPPAASPAPLRRSTRKRSRSPSTAQLAVPAHGPSPPRTRRRAAATSVPQQPGQHPLPPPPAPPSPPCPPADPAETAPGDPFAHLPLRTRAAPQPSSGPATSCKQPVPASSQPSTALLLLAESVAHADARASRTRAKRVGTDGQPTSGNSARSAPLSGQSRSFPHARWSPAHTAHTAGTAQRPPREQATQVRHAINARNAYGLSQAVAARESLEQQLQRVSASLRTEEERVLQLRRDQAFAAEFAQHRQPATGTQSASTAAADTRARELRAAEERVALLLDERAQLRALRRAAPAVTPTEAKAEPGRVSLPPAAGVPVPLASDVLTRDLADRAVALLAAKRVGSRCSRDAAEGDRSRGAYAVHVSALATGANSSKLMHALTVLRSLGIKVAQPGSQVTVDTMRAAADSVAYSDGTLKPDISLALGRAAVRAGVQPRIKHDHDAPRPIPAVTRAGTRGFRAPEVLVASKAPHTTAVDMWSAGVMLLSIMSRRYPFFHAAQDLASLAEVLRVLGYARHDNILLLDRVVSAEHMPTVVGGLRTTVLGLSGVPWPEELFDLLAHCLDLDPARRITAADALDHPFFLLDAAAVDSALFPGATPLCDGGRGTALSERDLVRIAARARAAEDVAAAQARAACDEESVGSDGVDEDVPSWTAEELAAALAEVADHAEVYVSQSV